MQVRNVCEGQGQGPCSGRVVVRGSLPMQLPAMQDAGATHPPAARTHQSTPGRRPLRTPAPAWLCSRSHPELCPERAATTCAAWTPHWAPAPPTESRAQPSMRGWTGREQDAAPALPAQSACQGEGAAMALVAAPLPAPPALLCLAACTDLLLLNRCTQPQHCHINAKRLGMCMWLKAGGLPVCSSCKPEQRLRQQPSPHSSNTSCEAARPTLPAHQHCDNDPRAGAEQPGPEWVYHTEEAADGDGHCTLQHSQGRGCGWKGLVGQAGR